MIEAVYMRLHMHALDTNRDVIREASAKLAPDMFTRARRADRHRFLRGILECHWKARALYVRSFLRVA